MFSWILALLLALVVWLLCAAWFWLVKRRRQETTLGLQALAGMHWRDFSEMVKRAMREQRGLRDAPGDAEDSREPRSDFLMDDPQQQRWLVSCKHGRAYRIGTAAVNELGAAARLAGARGGILITEGRVQRDGRAAADKQIVEVLDGHLLWPMLRPYLPGDMEHRVQQAARHEAIRRMSIAGLGSLTLGLLVGMGYLTARLDQAPPVDAALAVDRPAKAAAAAPPAAAPDAAPPAPSPAPATAPAAATPATAPALAGPDADPDPDPATLARYQKELIRELATQPGVVNAFWLTRQTLAINRSGDIDAIWPRICTEVKRYPALRTVRIQLNPRPGVEETVRWRQCATL